jgi:hypothetical protein
MIEELASPHITRSFRDASWCIYGASGVNYLASQKHGFYLEETFITSPLAANHYQRCVLQREAIKQGAGVGGQRGGADRQGSMRADGGGFTAPNRCQPIAELPLPLAARSPMKIPPTSGLDDLATPVLHSPERALDGTTSLTGRTARALFRSNPGHHASGMRA